MLAEMEFSSSTIVALTAAITSLINVPLTVVLTRGVDAWLKIRGAKRQEKVDDDNREDNEYKFVIAELKAVVSTQQARIDTGHADHLECVKSHGILEGRVIQMEHELATYRKLAQPALPAIPGEHDPK